MAADQSVVAVNEASKSVRLPTGADLLLLDRVGFSVAPGSSMAITGRSGSGKTTLLRALGLFTPFDEGEHTLLGTDVRSATDAVCSRLRARSIGFVFQEFRLLPNLNAFQNVSYACLLAGMGRRERKAATSEVLDRVGLSDRHRSRPAQLSGGEQQRVSIARALVKNPALVLADEPTGALDSDTAENVMSLLLHTVSGSGAALIVVTHDARVASLCDQHLELVKGKLNAPSGSLEVNLI